MGKMCQQFFVSGRVQGVWFRASTKQQAKALSLTGFAKNLADGRVEVIACGEQHAIQQLEQWLSQGPEKARVDQVESQIIDWLEFEKFSTK